MTLRKRVVLSAFAVLAAVVGLLATGGAAPGAGPSASSPSRPVLQFRHGDVGESWRALLLGAPPAALGP